MFSDQLRTCVRSYAKVPRDEMTLCIFFQSYLFFCLSLKSNDESVLEVKNDCSTKHAACMFCSER